MEAVGELMVDPTDTLECERDEASGKWFMTRISEQGRQYVVAEGETLDDVLWDLKTSVHPKASEDRVKRREQRKESQQ